MIPLVAALAACEPPPPVAADSRQVTADSPPPAPAPASPPTANGQRPTACPTPVPHYAALTDVPLPPRWVRTSAPQPDSESLRCANLSRREWVLDSSAQPVPAPPRAGDKVPFKVDTKTMRGTAHVKAVDDGVLVGFDAGEWGGSLWWATADGSSKRQLAAENVIGFADLGGKPIALVGLAHLGMSQGKVLHLAKAPDWKVTGFVDLGAAVQAYANETPDTILALTTSGLYRVTACGDVSLVAPARYDVLYPSSMTIDKSGVVTIGMRHYVTRWIPTGDGFREEWLTTDDCTLMQIKKFDCVCRR